MVDQLKSRDKYPNVSRQELENTLEEISQYILPHFDKSDGKWVNYTYAHYPIELARQVLKLDK